MSIKIISFIFSSVFFLILSLLISFFFINFSSKYYIELKKNEVRSYGNILSQSLESINFSILNNVYILNLIPSLPEYSYFVIFDKNNNILFYFPYYFQVDENFIKEHSFKGEKIIFDDKNYLITYFCSIKNNEYGIAFEIDLSIIRDFKKNLIKISIYFIPLYIFLSLLFSNIVSSIVQNRLKIIRDFAVKVALGNLNYNPDYKYKDELEDVFKSIKIMKNNLINLINDLNKSQKILQKILNSLPFTVILISDENKINIFNNPYNLDPLQIKERLKENSEIIDYENKKFKIIKIQMLEGILVIVIDFTEIYEIEKLKIKFLSEISHDLRTPLASAKSILSNIKTNDQKENEMIKKSIKYLDKINEMINKYLNFSKIKLRKININKKIIPLSEIFELINDTIAFFNCEISIELPQSIPNKFVQLDIDLFQQMIFNIIDNSQKNSSLVKIMFIFKEQHLEIIIKNSCSYEDYQLVKDIFYKMKDTKGLGLNIIKEISLINDTPIEISYESHEISFLISINYAPNSF